MGRLDEGALLSAAVAGDSEALGALLEAHYDRCFAVCRRILWDPQDALDATQEAMIAIARGLARFDGRSAFSTWCYRVATNAALDELRRRNRRPVPLRAAALDPSGTRGEAGTKEGGVAAGAVAAQADPVGSPVVDRLAVEAALSRLPEDQRVAVVLRDIADLDYAEIAAVLEVPLGTVRSRIARGRGALALLLADPPARGAPGSPSTEGNFRAPGGVGTGEESR